MMSVNTFCEVYDESSSAIYTHHSLKDTPFIIKTATGGVLVDDKALIRRREFYIRVWEQSHKYYYILNELKKDSKIAEILSKYVGRSKSSWKVFLNHNLFSNSFKNRSLLRYKIDERLWIFWRVSGTIIRRAYREARK